MDCTDPLQSRAPAQAGAQGGKRNTEGLWVPAFAGTRVTFGARA